MEDNYSNYHISMNNVRSPTIDPSDHSHTPHATSEVSREEILRTIFGDVGDLINDFSCAVESTVLLHGRMYITNRFLCFYSNLFGLEKKIRVPYSHITLITKENTALVIPNAIAVTTHRKEYLFRSFWDRDECYKLLQEMISRHRHDSDADSRLRAGSKIEPVVISNNNKRISTFKNSINLSNSNNSQTISSTTIPGTLQASNVNAAVNILPDDDVETETETGLVDGATSDTTDYTSAFNDEINRCKLKTTVISDSLPISLKDFITLFVDDAAIHSWKSYHESVGDTKVEVTNWTELSSTLGMGREMKFVKPIPAIKSSTRGVKVQRFRRFGDFGLVLCSSTRLEDVPAADSFSVEDVVSIKSIGDNKISIDIYFEVKFIKSTMFRILIESNTNSEMIKWIEAFFNKLKSICNQRLQNISSKLVPLDLSTVVPTEASKNNSGSNNSTAIPTRNSSVDTLDSYNVETIPKPVESSTSTILKLLNFVDKLLENFGLKGGRIYWSSYILLLFIFLFCGYQFLQIHVQLYKVNQKLSNIEKLLYDLKQDRKDDITSRIIS